MNICKDKDMALEKIRARYVEIHERARWSNSQECFDYDVQDMSPEMLLDLAEVYRALATWKRSYEARTTIRTAATPRPMGDLAA